MTDQGPTRRDAFALAGAAALALTPTAGRAASAPGAAASLASATKPRKIALEEHFILPDFVGYLADTKQNINPALFGKAVPILSDFGDQRLDVMDANSVDFVVLSLSGPGVQIELDAAKAVRLARSANDRLAVQIQKQPTRYGGFAHLALQDPTAAADELERCMRDLKFQGAMINGQTHGVYLDDPRYEVFWERVSALKAAIYLHPGNPQTMAAPYVDHPELWGPTWSWAAETCTHALRLIFRGTFDRHPDARLILGHMGETLPIQLWRLDSRYPISNHGYTIAKKPSDYLRENVFITTSGVCSDAALRCALEELGPRNVMFSIDYPFENTKIACDWIAEAKVTDAERAAVTHGNAEALLGLKT